MSSISTPVLVIGEALVDIVRRADGTVDESPGGSPANVALTLGRLGHAVTLLTRLGHDVRGRTVRAWLADSGVEVASADAPRTATATATLDAEGSATYEFDIEWDLPWGEIGAVGTVHIGSIAAVVEPGASTVERLVADLRDRATVTYDPNVRPALLPDRDDTRQRVERLVTLADVVKASDEDLAWLYPDRDPLESARAWQRTGPAIIAVTRGGSGATAVTDATEVTVVAPSVDVVDTVGAGDSFMGAMIDALVERGYDGASARGRLRAIAETDVRSVLEHAARVAAVTVSRPGADPPRRRDLAAAVSTLG